MAVLKSTLLHFCGAVKCEDVTALALDLNVFLDRVLDHPADYDITKTTSYCP